MNKFLCSVNKWHPPSQHMIGSGLFANKRAFCQYVTRYTLHSSFKGRERIRDLSGDLNSITLQNWAAFNCSGKIIRHIAIGKSFGFCKTSFDFSLLLRTQSFWIRLATSADHLFQFNLNGSTKHVCNFHLPRLFKWHIIIVYRPFSMLRTADWLR